jgi:bifunctional DNA-binding transcriptional regulator/antitoxin component of YhaV-PrlF toxin-antitoxin module
MSGMAQSVTLDERGRVLLPSDARRKAGIKPKAKLLVEVRGAGVIELKDYDALSRQVRKVAAKKLSGWREEEHREDKLLMRLSRTKGLSKNCNCLTQSSLLHH